MAPFLLLSSFPGTPPLQSRVELLYGVLARCARVSEHVFGRGKRPFCKLSSLPTKFVNLHKLQVLPLLSSVSASYISQIPLSVVSSSSAVVNASFWTRSLFSSKSTIVVTMHYSIIPAIALAGASFVSTHPLEERAAVAKDFNPPPGGDVTILNYALTLEYLERKFYSEGLANYSQADFVGAGFPDPFFANLKEIYYDEQVSLVSFPRDVEMELTLNRHTSLS
jgi:hypothetical protein